MKVTKFSVAAAVLAAGAFIGCSADNGSQSEIARGGKSGSMSFNLLANGNVQIDNINYDVKTQSGTEVVTGAIPVPDDQSQHVPVLGIQSLSSADYSLSLSATGKLPDGTSVPCTSPTTGFHVTSGSNTFVGDITLTCTVTVQSDTSGSATADVSVSTVTNTVGSVIETFAYGPRTVNGKTVGGACTFPPVALNITNSNTAIAYSWAATPDGTFTLNTAKTQGTYNCATPGPKTLTLTGTLNGQTSTKSVTVTCAPCGVCGNGVIEPGEQCDEATPRCTACVITPVCGDGAIDAPETCEPPNTATCNAVCQSPNCGNGVKEGVEQCDNGSANSNTTPNACRTNCTNPSCGDSVVDTGEQCDPPNGTTCSTTCQNIVAAPFCGDGVVNQPSEQCEPPNTATCDASCKTIVVQDIATQCETCLSANSVDSAFEGPYCLSDPLCKAVQDCTLNAKCFNPIPALCYCGITDATACSADSFVPTGACVTSILAGAGPLTLGAANTNNLALARFFDPGFSTGIGELLINDAATPAGTAGECFPKCFP